MVDKKPDFQDGSLVGDRVVGIQVFRPLENKFSYLDLEGEARVGSLVEVPFGNTTVKGVVRSVEIGNAKEFPYQLKDLKKVFPKQYDLRPDQLELADWMVDYYHSRPGEVLPLFAAPSPLRKAREIEEQVQRAKEMREKVQRQ